jgi:Rps23 Pro-64 3,4-dihydroxylase Tpa1-like proline 4-hydroxylase
MTVDVVVIDGFLSVAGMQDMHAYAVSREADFDDARVLRGSDGEAGAVDQKIRSNLHLKGPGVVPAAFLDRIRGAVPALAGRLDSGALDGNGACLADARFEAEITATGDGGFFTAHRDNAHPRIEDRLLTFVYFFGSSPRGFEGGELCVERNWRAGNRIFFHDASPGDGGLPSEMVDVVTPDADRLVLFRGDRVHEVRPVVLRSGDFASSRFTVTGWVRSRGAHHG